MKKKNTLVLVVYTSIIIRAVNIDKDIRFLRSRYKFMLFMYFSTLITTH